MSKNTTDELKAQIHNLLRTVMKDDDPYFEPTEQMFLELISNREKLAITGETSDGYHTFNELYHYRMLYNALYVNELVKNNPYSVHKSKRHSDGELAFGGGWFVVTMDLPAGQVTNHYELKDWDKFHCAELDKAPEWDGHTPQEAAERMEATLRKELDGEKQQWKTS